VWAEPIGRGCDDQGRDAIGFEGPALGHAVAWACAREAADSRGRASAGKGCGPVELGGGPPLGGHAPASILRTFELKEKEWWEQ
jgi:hypothetical protein